MPIAEQVHNLDAPPSPPQPRPQRLPWAVAAVAAAIAVLALIPKPAVEPTPPAPVAPESESQQIGDTFPGTDSTCRSIVDGSVTVEDHGGTETWGHVVTGTDLAVCVWLLPKD